MVVSALNNSIEDVNLSGNCIRQRGAVAICTGLQVGIVLPYLAAAATPITRRTNVIWQKAESFFVCIYQLAAGICNCMFWLEVRRTKSTSPGVEGPHLILCVIGPYKCTCQMASKSVERFKQGARM